MIKEMPDDEVILALASIICYQDHLSVVGTYRYSSGTYKLVIRGGTVEITNILTSAKAVIMRAT